MKYGKTIKKIAGFLAGIVTGIFGFITLRDLLQDNGTTDAEAGRNTDRLSDVTGKLSDSTEQLGRNNQELSGLIEDIKKQKFEE